MTLDRTDLLRKLPEKVDDQAIEQVRRSLGDPATRLLGDRAPKVSVAEALRLWSTRAQNRDVTEQELVGIDKLLAKLESLTRQKKLAQVAFVGTTTAGNLFFEGSGRQEFVGAVTYSTARRR